MDELLRQPESTHQHAYRTVQTEAARRREARREALRSNVGRLLAAAQVAGERLRVWSYHTYHRLNSARAGRPLVDPLPFLAGAAVIGIAATVGLMYTPSYVVTVDGTDIGTVRNQSVFEKVEDRVEARASAILGYDYTLQQQVSYDFALTKRGELTPVANFESYLFNSIDEVFRGYTLTVDGTFIGAAADRATLDALLDEVKAGYVTENTVSAEFVETVRMTSDYLPASINQDHDNMFAALTANTNGETSYEVVKGDTFMAIANANGMTMAELEELNPGVDVNRLYIGQLLTVKEEIPFLSVRTVDNETYEEPIECPVEERPTDSLYQGESQVIEAGVPGVALVNADVTYLNGKEEEREVLSTQTVTEPTTRIIAVGTKVRPSWYPTGSFIWPTTSHRINSRFGWRSIFGSYSYHGGIDIAASYGQNVVAADGGTVIYSGWMGGYGNLVIIDHGNGMHSYYGHNSSLKVSVGQHVHQGQTVAGAGSTGRSTGVHCHFEVRINGTRVNPLAYLP